MIINLFGRTYVAEQKNGSPGYRLGPLLVPDVEMTQEMIERIERTVDGLATIDDVKQVIKALRR